MIVGKITGAHGVGGEMKFLPLVDDSAVLRKLRSGYLVDERENKKMEIRISGWRYSGERVFVFFDGVVSREDAKNYSGLFLAVSRKQLPEPPADRFFISDLLGSRIVDEKRGDVGVLENILQTGAHDILLVKRQGKRDLLIPYLRHIVKDVRSDKKTIDVVLPEGLFEIYDS